MISNLTGVEGTRTIVNGPGYLIPHPAPETKHPSDSTISIPELPIAVNARHYCPITSNTNSEFLPRDESISIQYDGFWGLMKLCQSDTRPLRMIKRIKENPIGVRDLEFAHAKSSFPEKGKILFVFLFDPLFSQRVDSK